MSTDANGNVVVVGSTQGVLPGETSAGVEDAYVRKYDPVGNVLWTRQFGSITQDVATSVSVDASGNVVVAGFTGGTLAGQSSTGGGDTFVRKYDAAGNVLWTRQFGSSGDDVGQSVSVDASGNVVVAGYSTGTLLGQTSAGGADMFVRRYDSAGNVLWTRQFGSNNNDNAAGVSVDASGNIFAAGYTNGVLPGQTSAGSNDAFVIKYDSAGNLLWIRQFGTSGLDGATSASVDASGSVILTGYTTGALLGQASAGGFDVFVSKYDSAGSLLWTRQFGSSVDDVGYSVNVAASGKVAIAGRTTGALPGQTSAGSDDAFVRQYDNAGNVLWTRQFGTSGYDFAYAASTDASGNVFAAGYTTGVLPGQSSAGSSDAFVTRLVP